MKNIDRILGILLVLQAQRRVSARALAAEFGVSTRTIYRDLAMLSLLGVPVYAERGRNGGIRLLEGYFLPPLMFTRDEAIALLLGLALLRSLRAAPFPDEAITATEKLLAAVPEPLRVTLAHLERVLGIERAQADLLHPEPNGEPATSPPLPPGEGGRNGESGVISAFLQALLDHDIVRLHYRSPYREAARVETARPLGLFWDRDRWYLVGRPFDAHSQDEHEGRDGRDGQQRQRIWRADRVIELALCGPQRTSQQGSETSDKGEAFDVRGLLGHAWLRTAMEDWRRRVPVRLRITQEQAHQLQQDWYYRHAQYEPSAGGAIIMTFGEADSAMVLPLLRWLGPGAELISPESWRALIHAELMQMLRSYGPGLDAND